MPSLKGNPIVLKKLIFNIFAILVMFLCHPFLLTSQVYTNKEISHKSVEQQDSILKPYPYVLPVWGAKAAEKGFDLPYSAGFGINYVWQESDLIIENLQIGFNSGPMHNLDEIVRFHDAKARLQGVNFRPDIWILPFLNVYGILSTGTPSTMIDFGVWIPDSTHTWSEVFKAKTKAQFSATSFGFGLTPTMGVGGGWMALDMNFTWNDIDALERPAFAFVFGPRFGKSFALKKPEQSLTFWAGAFRLHINTGTKGTLPLSQFIAFDGLQEKVDNGISKVEDSQQQVDDWWDNLSMQQQANPINKAKYETANRALEKAGNAFTAMDAALHNAENSTITYSLDKRPKDMWNFIVGTQYQLNKHLMIRGEYGFLGSRQQFIGMLQYRFGL